jgi:type II secretory ATPase GspE/PulE/Tfp pilus assembly ATPase PilB-like protein
MNLAPYAERIAQRLPRQLPIDTIRGLIEHAAENGLSPVRALAHELDADDALIEVYCAIANIPTVNPASSRLTVEQSIAIVPAQVIESRRVLPYDEDGRVAVIVTAEVPTTTLRDDLARVCRRPVRLVFAREHEIDAGLRAFAAAYARYLELQSAQEILDASVVEDDDEEGERGQELDPNDETRVIENIVRKHLRDASMAGANDVHFHPQLSVTGRQDLWVRRSQNGRTETVSVHSGWAGAMTRAAKALAGLGIDPYDCDSTRWDMTSPDGSVVQWRVSSVPTDLQGCAAVTFRRHGGVLIPLTDLGFSPDIYSRLMSITQADKGLFLIGGGTGDGKSTTIYAVLSIIGEAGVKNIMTAEDPVEHHIEGVLHTSIAPERDYTYKTALRQFLRMSPDVMFFGEVRDSDGADVVLEAAETGHLVFSTLHINRAYTAHDRLIAMLEGEVGRPAAVQKVVSQLSAVMEQRLARMPCPACRERVPVDPKLSLPAGASRPEFVYEEGKSHCTVCNHTHTSGRMGIGELLIVNTEFKEAVRSGASEDELERLAIESCKMVPLREAAWELCAQGRISQSAYRTIAEEDVADARV